LLSPQALTKPTRGKKGKKELWCFVEKPLAGSSHQEEAGLCTTQRENSSRHEGGIEKKKKTRAEK
jgi:hypothetical protein